MRHDLYLAGIAMTLLFAISERATAQIETLVMPGDVIEGHADLEAECSSCHQAFQRSKQRALCLDCHEDINADIESGSGFHGLDRRASRKTCADCHADHEGRDADIVQLDESGFDHDVTNFALLGKHIEAPCADCHESGTKHREAQTECFACHEPDNVHGETMGTECGDCHAPTAWLDVEFDHDTTEYPLVGKHMEAECSGCHEDQTFQDTPTTCFSCHAEDDHHEGRSGQECGNCHSPTGWTDTSFDHARDTQFLLDGKHAELVCGDCHTEDPFADELDTKCVSCHLENDNHEGHFGDDCGGCHTSTAWENAGFDHEVATSHALNGAHEPLECNACHIEPVFSVELQTDCLSCHEDDDTHEGTQGSQCLDCHTEHSWQEDVFFDHDLTRFPLLGAHAEPECDACHDSKVFRDAPENCIDCHREVDPHAGRFVENCALCHNPVDWQQWRFDHNTQSSFVLDGAHRDVSCESCHRRPMAQQSRLGSRCADCHRSDDIHDGEFGFDCGRCHSADSFRDVRSIQ